MICAQSIMHFRPNASYEKYLKMLVSVMILIQLFLPVGRLVFGSSAEQFAARVKEFEKTLDMGMRQAQESARQSQEKLEKMTLEQVQELLPSEMQEESVSEDKIEIQIAPVEQIQIEETGEEEKENEGYSEPVTEKQGTGEVVSQG